MTRFSYSAALGLMLVLWASVHEVAQAHIEMKTPFAISSKFDPANTGGGGNVDYSNTRPLAANGADFPCLGHLNDPAHNVAEYIAGQQYPLELVGSATHNGGSCQISLSYDNGATFRVIKSMIGNCPIPLSYKFTIPASAPAGQNVLLAWSWFNKVGNREMYMNCAHVTIKSSANGASWRRRHVKRAPTAGLDSSFPEIFKANIFSGTPQSSCHTGEGQDVVFPNPGPDVEYGIEALRTAPPTNFPGCPASNGKSAVAASAPESPPPSKTTTGEVPAAHAASHTGDAAPAGEATTTAGGGGSDEHNGDDAKDRFTLSTKMRVIAPASMLSPPEDMARSSGAPMKASAVAKASSSSSASSPAAPAAAENFPSSSSASSPASSVAAVAAKASTSSSASVSSPAAAAKVHHSSSSAVSPAAKPSGTSTGPPSLSAPAAKKPCSAAVAGAVQCSNDGGAWSVCSNGSWVGMGAVAAGTLCRDGAVVRTSGLGACARADEGTIRCRDGGAAWSVCAGGAFISMGGVAAGTKCAAGKIVAAV